MSEGVFHFDGELDLMEVIADRKVESCSGVRDVDGRFECVLRGNILGWAESMGLGRDRG